jgi:hypothetical protein
LIFLSIAAPTTPCSSANIGSDHGRDYRSAAFRLAIRRQPFPTDILVWLRFVRLTRRLKPHVLHGHGARAGALVRLKRRAKDSIRVYTPHGGSLHYPLNTPKGAISSRLARLGGKIVQLSGWYRHH